MNRSRGGIVYDMQKTSRRRLRNQVRDPQILERHQRGMSRRAIAREFGISATRVAQVIREQQAVA